MISRLPAVLVAALLAATAVAATTAEEARTLLERAAAETDPAQAQALARQAGAALAALPEGDPPDCARLAMLAEARLRGGQPQDAVTAVARGMTAGCDEAAFTSLAAWAAEHAPDGVRRGTGADLPRARLLYLRAAELFRGRTELAAFADGAMASAGELSLHMGDLDGARAAALQLLRPEATDDVAVRAAALLIAATSPQLGEGAAADLAGEKLATRPDVLRDALHRRNAQVGALLDRTPDDPHLLAAAGFYSLLSGDAVGAHLASRHLDRALKAGGHLPDASYLRGRAADVLGDVEAAKASWKRQQQDYPGASASRLAANDLAWLLATKGGTPQEMAEALAALEPWLAADPGEAALHETRGLLLERLGRRSEALEAMTRAHGLAPTPERKAALTRLQPGG